MLSASAACRTSLINNSGVVCLLYCYLYYLFIDIVLVWGKPTGL